MKVELVDLFAEEKGGLSKRMHKLRVFFISLITGKYCVSSNVPDTRF